MQQKVVKEYSEAFKLTVIGKIEKEGMSITSASKRYNCTRDSIYNWLVKYGKNHLLCIKVKVMTTDEQDELLIIKAQLKEAKEAMFSLQMRCNRFESIAEQACKQLKVSPDFFLTNKGKKS